VDERAFRPSVHPRQRNQAVVLAVTSGKGGVGKTVISANLAAVLAGQGQRVLVLDADLGLANLDVLLNLYSPATLHDVFTGKASVQQAVLSVPGGFDAVLAGSGMVEYSRLTSEVRGKFHQTLQSLIPGYDIVILDTGAGISDVVLYAIGLADEVLVVATPEPTSLTDAYATIKVLAAQQNRQHLLVAVNQASRPGDGQMVVAQLQRVLDRFVNGAGTDVRLFLVGEVDLDPAVRDSVQKRQLLVSHAPQAPAARAIAQMARQLTALLHAPGLDSAAAVRPRAP
jgi:flagellar biosynthesis protein FlhG